VIIGREKKIAKKRGGNNEAWANATVFAELSLEINN
jgi:hypothetical protein